MAQSTRGDKTTSVVDPDSSAFIAYPGEHPVTHQQRPDSSYAKFPPTDHDLAGVLHEVSNALTVILGWIERARDGHDPTRALDIATSRARDARRIIRRTINAHTVDAAGESAPLPISSPAQVRTLADTVADAVAGLEPEALRSSITLQTFVDPLVATHTVHDAPVIVQILTNLLLNAIGVSPSRSVVRVNITRDNNSSVIRISDQGPGIPPERRATLFSAGISTRLGGAGIGLRHSAALAGQAGGMLSLVPTECGACFELRWPLLLDDDADTDHQQNGQQASSDDDASPKSPDAVLQGFRILVIEDDAAVVDLLDMALTARGADIVSVRTANEIPQALATGPFHIALLDLSPIAQDVPGTVSALRRASPRARLVVMSGNVGDVPDGLDHDTSWIRKPFEVRDIVDILLR